MRVGIVTPVLTRVTKSHAKWEVDAGIEDVARIATAADALGYDYLTCSEHVGIPTDVAPVRGMLVGGGRHKLTVSVDVKRIEAPAPEAVPAESGPAPDGSPRVSSPTDATDHQP